MTEETFTTDGREFLPLYFYYKFDTSNCYFVIICMIHICMNLYIYTLLYMDACKFVTFSLYSKALFRIINSVMNM